MKLIIGVCQGHHEMPCTEFVFGQEVNPLDVKSLEHQAEMFFAAYRDVRSVTIYVTGLTVAVIAVIKAAMQLTRDITLMHYDRESNSYYAQAFWPGHNMEVL